MEALSKTILNKIMVEATNNGFSAYIDGLDGIVATGSTIEETKKNLMDALDEYMRSYDGSGNDN